MLRTLSRIFVALASISLAAPASAAILVFGSELGPEAAGATGTGFGRATFDTDLHTLLVEANWSGLSGTTTVAHIHCCTAVRGNGHRWCGGYPGHFPAFPGRREQWDLFDPARSDQLEQLYGRIPSFRRRNRSGGGSGADRGSSAGPGLSQHPQHDVPRWRDKRLPACGSRAADLGLDDRGIWNGRCRDANCAAAFARSGLRARTRQLNLGCGPGLNRGDRWIPTSNSLPDTQAAFRRSAIALRWFFYSRPDCSGHDKPSKRKGRNACCSYRERRRRTGRRQRTSAPFSSRRPAGGDMADRPNHSRAQSLGGNAAQSKAGGARLVFRFPIPECWRRSCPLCNFQSWSAAGSIEDRMSAIKSRRRAAFVSCPAPSPRCPRPFRSSSSAVATIGAAEGNITIFGWYSPPLTVRELTPGSIQSAQASTTESGWRFKTASPPRRSRRRSEPRSPKPKASA